MTAQGEMGLDRFRFVLVAREGAPLRGWKREIRTSWKEAEGSRGTGRNLKRNRKGFGSGRG